MQAIMCSGLHLGLYVSCPLDAGQKEINPVELMVLLMAVLGVRTDSSQGIAWLSLASVVAG